MSKYIPMYLGPVITRWPVMVRTMALSLAFAFIAAGAAYAADTTCCKTCCHGQTCVMNHRASHDCLGHTPCH